MSQKLTHTALLDRLQGLRAQAVRIARDYPAGDQAEAIAGLAEVIEMEVDAVDLRFFHDEVGHVIADVGACEPEPTREP